MYCETLEIKGFQGKKIKHNIVSNVVSYGGGGGWTRASPDSSPAYASRRIYRSSIINVGIGITQHLFF